MFGSPCSRLCSCFHVLECSRLGELECSSLCVLQCLGLCVLECSIVHVLEPVACILSEIKLKTNSELEQ